MYFLFRFENNSFNCIRMEATTSLVGNVSKEHLNSRNETIFFNFSALIKPTVVEAIKALESSPERKLGTKSNYWFIGGNDVPCSMCD